MPNQTKEENSKTAKELNNDIKQLVCELNALVDSEFELRQAQKSADYCKVYMAECTKAVEACMKKYISSMDAYTSLTASSLKESPEKFSNLYYKLRAKYSGLEAKDQKAIEITEWEIPYDGGCPTFTQPLYVEPAMSWATRSMFIARHHYKRGLNHISRRSARSHIAQLESAKIVLTEKFEKTQAAIKQQQRRISETKEEVRALISKLSTVKEQWQSIYEAYAAVVKTKLIEFDSIYKQQRANGEIHSVWRSLRFRSKHKPEEEEDTINITAKTNFPDFHKPAETSPHSNDLKAFEEPSCTPTLDLHIRYCMHCKFKTRYIPAGNMCVWVCNGCVQRGRDFSGLEAEGVIQEHGIITNPLMELDHSTRERIGVKFPTKVWNFLNLQHQLDSRRSSAALQPMDQNIDTCQSIYIGPKGESVPPNQLQPNHLERLFFSARRVDSQ